MNNIFLAELSKKGLLETWLRGSVISDTKSDGYINYYNCQDFDFFADKTKCVFVSNGQKFSIDMPFDEFHNLAFAILIYQNEVKIHGEQYIKRVVKINNFLEIYATFSIENVLVDKKCKILITNLKVVQNIQGIEDTIFKFDQKLSVEQLQQFLDISDQYLNVQTFVEKIKTIC
jgi:hypothetical protein